MSLIGEERKAYILQLIQSEGKVITNELVEVLQVSSETIRRYLEDLEEANKLKRVYGGAVRVNRSREEPSHLIREVLHADEKRRIGKAAAALVQDNEVIFIDDGSTTLQMIEHLLDKTNLTILTNSFPALYSLIDYKNRELYTGELFFIGGKVSSMQFRVVGSLAEKLVTNFYADKAFISIDGMMIDKGITAFDEERGKFARKLMEHAKTNIVVSDHSKIGMVQFHKMSDLQDIDIIVSGVPAPEAWKPELEHMGVAWIASE
ncbi:DeoR/GlpR family DNA-binding transcription regulator [Paenibacillus sp. GCM10023248]|uniref:DeoR/GlpR family DNA-binding transcription regulator n=1 Tax=Bacillales TaxID=1385 RepID=UPI00237967D4|nr:MULTISPECIES: DeoR/GlpR family DNA-binding transcription regulator [Bacillales]MDD9266755.1 DeoR/GlpR family DNA-binding transcription regulator [Paenibacillus sp. MAHUQ-63]MDR6883700.1 DeoR/GlpR family transcriptional regulator of sugar metabolism [Bacillus sp. 3255]